MTPIRKETVTREAAVAFLKKRGATKHSSDTRTPPAWVAYRLKDGGWARVEASRLNGKVQLLEYRAAAACPCAGASA